MRASMRDRVRETEIAISVELSSRFPAGSLVPLCNREISRNPKSATTDLPPPKLPMDSCMCFLRAASPSKCKRKDFSANYVTRQIAIVIYCYPRNFFLYVMPRLLAVNRAESTIFETEGTRGSWKPWRRFIFTEAEGVPSAWRTESKNDY